MRKVTVVTALWRRCWSVMRHHSACRAMGPPQPERAGNAMKAAPPGSSSSSSEAGVSVACSLVADHTAQTQQPGQGKGAAAGARLGGSHDAMSDHTDISISSVSSQQPPSQASTQDTAAAHSSRLSHPQPGVRSEAAGPAAVAVKEEALGPISTSAAEERGAQESASAPIS